MRESIHQQLARTRKSRVRFEYSSSYCTTQQYQVIPLVVGVIGNFSGNAEAPAKPLAERRFLEIDIDNFDTVMRDLGVGLSYTVENVLANDGSALQVNLRFGSLADFRPDRVAAQVAPLGELLAKRGQGDAVDAGSGNSDFEEQLRTIMHHQTFQRLEGSWRGLHYLVHESDTNSELRIKLCDVDKRELVADLVRATATDEEMDFRKSWLHERLYTDGYAIDSAPYGALIGDYEFTAHPDDIALLRGIARVATHSLTPFVSAVSSEFFGFLDWREFNRVLNLEALIQEAQYAAWNEFRDNEVSRFVTLTLPRILARLPHGAATNPIWSFDFEEIPADRQGDFGNYCWMSVAYALGVCLTRAFRQDGWCVAIRGMEGGGLVERLPFQLVDVEGAESAIVGPTETAITERREYELAKLGFTPLMQFRNRDRAVFFSASTAHRPDRYDDPDVTASELLSTRLSWVMAYSRVAQYLRFMLLNHRGAFMGREKIERWLNGWLAQYVNANPDLDQAQSTRYPLLAAELVIEEGSIPDVYPARLFLRPRLPYISPPMAIRISLELEVSDVPHA